MGAPLPAPIPYEHSTNRTSATDPNEATMVPRREYRAEWGSSMVQVMVDKGSAFLQVVLVFLSVWYIYPNIFTTTLKIYFQYYCLDIRSSAGKSGPREED